MKGFEDQPIDWSPLRTWCADDGRPCQHLSFIVPGIAKPKGNIIKSQWGAYHDATKGLDDWLASVSIQARNAMTGQWRKRSRWPAPHGAPMFIEAVALKVDFVMPRPKTFTPPVWLKGKDHSLLWRSLFREGTPPMIKKPDLSKLVRGIEDAMTSVVWHDDSQVVAYDLTKRYVDGDETPGALISVSSADLG